MHLGTQAVKAISAREGQASRYDGETILMHYTGLIQQTDIFKHAAEANQPTEWRDQYMPLTMRFDTGAEQYRWLNTSLFVAKGRLLWTGNIEYAFYRIT